VRALLVSLILCASVAAQAPDLYDPSTVRTLKFTFKQSNWWQLLLDNYRQKIDIRADLEVDNVTYFDVGVRFRGTSSYLAIGNSQKKSFNITMDAFVSGQNLHGYQNLNLSNSYNDPTFLREVISYQFQRRYTAAPKCNFVKVVLNNESWGVYVNVQQPDKKMMAEWFKGNDGNRYRADPPTNSPTARSALQWLGAEKGPYQQSYELKTGQSQSAWTDLIAACDALNNKPIANVSSVIDVDRALWYLALMNVLVNLDSYLVRGNDYYIYFTEGQGILHVVPWDMNESFGGFNNRLSVNQMKQLTPFYQESNTERPLLNKLLAVPRWRAQYLAHVRTILAESFNPTAMEALIKKYHDSIRADVEADTKKLYSTALFTQALDQDAVIGSWPYRTTVPGLRPFVRDRAAFLNAFADINKLVPTVAGVAHAPAKPTLKDTVWVTATIAASVGVTGVELAYATGEIFTSVAMYDDGNHHDGRAGDGVFGGSIPPSQIGTTVRYYLRATASGGGMAIDPPRAELVTHAYEVAPIQGTSPIRISELLAKNDNGIRDEQGEREDWIELSNTGLAAVDLSGHHLTDDLDTPTRWTFPANTVMQPGATLLVWADNEPTEGPLHASFKLSAAGEEVGLFAPDGKTLLDRIRFGPQQADESTGRLHGFPSIQATFPAPTPRQANRPVPCGHLAYDALASPSTALVITAQGTPAIGSQVTFAVSGAPASTAGFLAIAVGPAQVDLGPLGALLVNPAAGGALLPVLTDSSGKATQPVPVPNLPILKGQSVYVQAFVLGGTTGGFSNAIVTRICP
jgi:hypothetical protein